MWGWTDYEQVSSLNGILAGCEAEGLGADSGTKLQRKIEKNIAALQKHQAAGRTKAVQKVSKRLARLQDKASAQGIATSPYAQHSGTPRPDATLKAPTPWRTKPDSPQPDPYTPVADSSGQTIVTYTGPSYEAPSYSSGGPPASLPATMPTAPSKQGIVSKVLAGPGKWVIGGAALIGGYLLVNR